MTAGSNSNIAFNPTPTTSARCANLRLTVSLARQSEWVAGETLEGVLELECTSASAVRLGDIWVELTGKEELKCDVIGETRCNRFLQLEERFQGPKTPPTDAVAGPRHDGFWLARRARTLFPFWFRLPETAPSTVAFKKDAASVTYTVTGYVKFILAGSVETMYRTATLEVVESLDDSTLKMAVLSKPVSSRVSRPSGVDLNVEIKRRFFQAGRDITIGVTVENMSRSKIGGLTVEILRVLEDGDFDHSLIGEGRALQVEKMHTFLDFPADGEIYHPLSVKAAERRRALARRDATLPTPPTEALAVRALDLHLQNATARRTASEQERWVDSPVQLPDSTAVTGSPFQQSSSGLRHTGSAGVDDDGDVTQETYRAPAAAPQRPRSKSFSVSTWRGEDHRGSVPSPDTAEPGAYVLYHAPQSAVLDPYMYPYYYYHPYHHQAYAVAAAAAENTSHVNLTTGREHLASTTPQPPRASRPVPPRPQSVPSTTTGCSAAAASGEIAAPSGMQDTATRTGGSLPGCWPDGRAETPPLPPRPRSRAVQAALAARRASQPPPERAAY
ncbi:hypothetical protein HK405_007436 [Cladochytrium tenue]|nr:hypothetical protein HK405_007436 [Cladochytrium tenue]